MNKQIPLYFDATVIDSPIQEIPIENSSAYQLKVRVFTKYANRNGSYITDEVAQQLIDSATNGITPVIGFFDPETQSWASHTGPTLASAYGYVDNFLGWESFVDSDNIAREYAVFSVNLFTSYFEEATKIIGQNQSMELDPQSITGDWAEINGEFLYVYTTAKMLGFCVIGSHEPCFSASSFFSNNEEEYKNQLQKISSMLFELKAQVEELNKKAQGGEQPMDENLNVQEVVEETAVVEEFAAAEPEQIVEPEQTVESEQVAEFEQQEVSEEQSPAETEVVEEVVHEFTELEQLQTKFNELTEEYNKLNNDYELAMNKISELENSSAALAAEMETLQSKNNELQDVATKYEEMVTAAELAKKNSLIEKYEKIIDEEEINRIRGLINDFSYEELESKLAISFANSQMVGSEVNKVPLPEPQESQFALLMKKYRKN